MKRLSLLLLTVILLGAMPPTIHAQSTFALPTEADLTDPRWAREGYAGAADLFTTKTRYLLSLDVEYPTGKITGIARILFVNSTPDMLNKAEFRLYPNHPLPPAYGGAYTGAKPRMLIQSVTVNGASINTKPRDKYQTVLDVPFMAPLKPGDGATIQIAYTVQYSAPGDILDAREAFPLLAVYENGAWREDIMTKSLDYVYSETALYAVTLRAANTYALYTTGSITKTDSEGSKVVYHITTGPVRDFVFQLTRGWGFLPAYGSPIPIDVRFKGRQEIAEEMAYIAAEAVNYYDQTFGPYFYAHLTLLSVVYPSGGEEYPTLIFVDSQRETNYRRFIVAHEVAHQWFYGIAGNDVARHAWLDESLSQIALYLFYRDRYSTEIAETEWQYILTWAKRLNGTARSIDTPVESFRDFNEYMVHNYGLGPVFLRSLAEQIGYDKFKAGLASYFEAASLKVGTPDMFYTAIQAQVPNQDLSPLFCRSMGFRCTQ